MREYLTMMTRYSLTARALTWFALAACTSDRALAPHIVAIAGATLRVDASLWRDFQPISPPDGKPLAAILTTPDLGPTRRHWRHSRVPYRTLAVTTPNSDAWA